MISVYLLLDFLPPTQATNPSNHRPHSTKASSPLNTGWLRRLSSQSHQKIQAKYFFIALIFFVLYEIVLIL